MYRAAVLVLLTMSLNLSGCGLVSGPKTIVAITNKITSLPAGQTYEFNIDTQHDQQKGFTLALTGQGTLLQTGQGLATYLAPALPSPNSVTVTVTAGNGSGVSDSNTFTITAASGPVVSISPATFTVSAHGSPVTLNISVTQDASTDTLMVGVSSSPVCNGACGSFGSITGARGGGAYTVQYSPPSSVTEATQQTVNVLSNLPNATRGTAFVTINP